GPNQIFEFGLARPSAPIIAVNGRGGSDSVAGAPDAHHALVQPLLVTGPIPSRSVSNWLGIIPLNFSCSPFGQKTSTSALVDAPRPKCRRGSLHEEKLAWLVRT